MTYETTKQAAARVRQTIKKELGLTAKDVSVRMQSFSRGSSITATIKSRAAAGKLEQIKAIAESASIIHRCEATGVILGGYNRYIHTNIDHALSSALAAEIMPELIAGVEATESGTYFSVQGVDVVRNGATISVERSNPDRLQEAWNHEAAAEIIALELLSR